MLSVIIPAYNESNNIAKTIRIVDVVLAGAGIEHETIIVDDGSNDGTYEKALAASQQCQRVEVHRYQDNSGKGFALRYGFRFTKGALVLFLDADSDLPPNQIPDFVSRFSEDNCDVLIGSKRHPMSEVNYPLLRRLLSFFFGLLVRILFGLNVKDTQTGLKLFRREVLSNVFPVAVVRGYAFDVELLAIAYKLGYVINEAPVKLDFQYDSRVNVRHVWHMFLDTLAIFYRMKLRHNSEPLPSPRVLT